MKMLNDIPNICTKHHVISHLVIVLALDSKSGSSELNVKMNSINITSITNEVLPP